MDKIDSRLLIINKTDSLSWGETLQSLQKIQQSISGFNIKKNCDSNYGLSKLYQSIHRQTDNIETLYEQVKTG